MVSSSGYARGARAKSGVLSLSAFPRLSLLLPLFILFACTAQKTPTDIARLFTADELLSRGVFLAPVAADPSLAADFKASDFAVYDQAFLHVMASHWERKAIHLANKMKGLESLDASRREAWRQAIATDQSAFDGPLAAGLESMFGTKPLLVHALILTNQVGCGQRDPLPSYNASQPALPTTYCQRLMKMQFQIFDRVKKEKVWSGLVYSSSESSEKVPKGRSAERYPEAPPVETLIRDAFKNFAQIMAGSLPDNT